MTLLSPASSAGRCPDSSARRVCQVMEGTNPVMESSHNILIAVTEVKILFAQCCYLLFMLTYCNYCQVI